MALRRDYRGATPSIHKIYLCRGLCYSTNSFIYINDHILSVSIDTKSNDIDIQGLLLQQRSTSTTR